MPSHGMDVGFARASRGAEVKHREWEAARVCVRRTDALLVYTFDKSLLMRCNDCVYRADCI